MPEAEAWEAAARTREHNAVARRHGSRRMDSILLGCGLLFGRPCTAARCRCRDGLRCTVVRSAVNSVLTPMGIGRPSYALHAARVQSGAARRPTRLQPFSACRT